MTEEKDVEFDVEAFVESLEDLGDAFSALFAECVHAYNAFVEAVNDAFTPLVIDVQEDEDDKQD